MYNVSRKRDTKYQCILLAVTNDAPWHYLQMAQIRNTPRDKFNEEPEKKNNLKLRVLRTCFGVIINIVIVYI